MPGKSFNLTAKINAQLGNVRPVVASLKRQLSGVKANVNLNISANALRNVSQLNRNLRALNQTLTITASVSRSAASGLTALSAAANSSNIAKVAKQAAQVNKAVSNISKSANAAKGQMEEFGRVSGLAIRRFSGFTVATGVVFGFINQLSNAVGKAIEFDQQLTRVAQATRSTKEGMRGLGGEITRLATGLGVSSESLAEVSITLAQAGLNARDTKVALEALAKSTLAPTFTDIKNTVEGSIAAIAQFEIGVKDLEAVLGSVNAVSAKFAVESDDIIAAVRRTGGVFAAASKGVTEGKEALNEFIAIFTSIRATTRESAETIATGLRTIFTRFQRPETVRNLQELGIELTDATGKFVGAYKAVDALAAGLRKLDPRDLRFGQIVEELGGFRQVSKVIPLILQTEKRLQALKVAKEGQNSLDKDAETAQESLANKISKVREEFQALIREISETSTFKTLVDLTLQLTKGLVDLARTFKPILPIIAAFGSIKLAGAATSFTSGFFKGARGRNEGGYAPKFHSGGLVPGGRGIVDDYPATLQAGEYVIRRKAVDKLGRGTLDKLNRTGYAQGGLVNQNIVGAALLRPEGELKTVSLNPITEEDTPAMRGRAPKSLTYTREALPNSVGDRVESIVKNGIIRSIDTGSEFFGGASFSNAISADRLLDSLGIRDIEGKIYEGILSTVNQQGVFDSSRSPQQFFDFTDGFNSVLSKHFAHLGGIKYIDAKANSVNAQPAELRRKAVNTISEEAGVSPTKQDDEFLGKRRPKTRSADAVAKEEAAKQARIAKQQARLAKQEARLSRAGGGEVPAILTRGEYVLSKKAADRIGPEMLDRLNNADRVPKFHNGGRVGYASGGTVPSGATATAVGNYISNAGAVSGQQGIIKAIRDIENAVKSFKAAGLAGKQLDRATRVFAKELNDGATATDAYNKATVQTAKAQQAAARRTSIIAPPGLTKGFSKGIGSGLRYLGRSAANSIGGAAGNTISGIRQNPLAALGGIAIATQSIGNQFDPRGTNAKVQGVTGALSGAAAGAAFGGPLGAIAGGAYGAASGVVNAQIAKANEDANKALQDSTKELDGAFKDFVKSGSLTKLDAAFSSISGANALKAGAIDRENAGVGGALYGTLGRAVGFSQSEGEQFGGNLINSLGNFTGLISNKDYDKGIARTKLGQYDQISVENQANADVARQFFEKQITSGKSVDDILKTSTGTRAAQTFLQSNLTSDQDKVEFQNLTNRVRNAGSDEDRTRAQSQLSSFVKNKFTTGAGKELADEVAVRNKLNEAILHTTQELDRFFDRLNNISGALVRANDVMALGAENLAAISNEIKGGINIGSKKNSKDLNVFGNLSGFSESEVFAASGRLNTRLGNSASSQELTANTLAAKRAEETIPSILARASEKSKLEPDENVNDFIINSLKSQLKNNGASDAIINNVVAKAQQEISSRKDSSGGFNAAFFTGFDLESFGQEAFKAVTKVTEDAAKTLDSAYSNYSSGITEFVKLQLDVNKLFANATKVRSEGALQLRGLRGDNITLDEATKPFETGLGNLTGGATNVKDIVNNIKSLTQQRNDNRDKAFAASEAGDAGGFQFFTEAAGSLEIAIQQNREALETLSTDTSNLGEIQSRLADLESKRQQSEKTLQDLAFGDKADRLEFNKRAGLANRLVAGEQLQGPQLQQALQTIAELSQVLSASGIIDPKRQKEIDKFGQNAVINNPFVQGIFGGVDPGLARIGGAVRGDNNVGERGQLLKAADAAITRQADAAEALARLQGDTNKFLDQLNGTLHLTIDTLNERGGFGIGRNSGGFIPGGGPNRDTVPAILTTGEFVVNRDAAQRNAGLLEQINSGARVPFANGGSVTREKAIAAAIARKNRLGRSTYFSTLALRATVAAGANASGNREKAFVQDAYNADYNARYDAIEARKAARKKFYEDAKPKYAARTGLANGLTASGNQITQIAREAAEFGRGNLTEKQLEFIRGLSPAQKAMGSRLFKQFKEKKQRTGTAFNKGGVVGGRRGYNRGGSVGGGDLSQLSQYAQAFASSAAQFERAAGILAKVNIPTKIEMTGNHTVQVIINGADVLSKMNEPIRQLVSSEINKALGRHINPVTGETTGEYNG